MARPARGGCAVALALLLCASAIALGASSSISVKPRVPDFDATSLIVRFHESIGDPVAVAALAPGAGSDADADVDVESARSATSSQKRAAEAAVERVLAVAREHGIEVVRTETFGRVMTGMSLTTALASDANRLAQILRADTSNVMAVHPVAKFKVSFERADAEGAEAAAAAVANAAAEPTAADPAIWGGADHSTLVDVSHRKYNGDGVRVAVIDDGLDFTHPAFGGCRSINSGGGCRVVAGHDFTDGDSVTYDTCGSHGTHVAGIIAGDSSHGSNTVPWTGVAPRALLGAYRVFGCDGMTQTSWLLSALERAVEDGMDVINLSMGTSWTAPLGVEFTTRLAKQGVIVVAAAGNSGDEGLWSYGAPAAEPDAVAVGSTDNTFSLGAAITISREVSVRGERTNVLTAPARALMQNPMFTGEPELVLPEPRSACGPISNRASISGRIAVVPTGTCTESDKAEMLLRAGAASVIFYDSRPYPAFKQSMNIDETVGSTAPQMFCVDQDTGLALVEALEDRQLIRVTGVTNKKVLNPNADKPSVFSSWGPDMEMRLLPQFSAPGGGILSSIPGNNFALYQGTSMATPYVTGSMALFRQARRGSLGGGRAALDAAKAAFITTAAPIPTKEDPAFMNSVVVVGAGMIQVRSAIENKVEVSPPYLALPTGQEEATVLLSFTNKGDVAVSYRLGHAPAVAVDTKDSWYGAEEQESIAARVSWRNNADTRDLEVLTVPAGETVRIKARVVAPDRLRAAPRFFSGYLTLTPITEAEAEAAGSSGRGGGSARRRMLLQAAEPAAEPAEAARPRPGARHPALSVPYLSLSQPYSQLAPLAGPRADVEEGRVLVTDSAYLCNLLDGSCATREDAAISTSPSNLEIGTLTFALPLTRPIASAYIEIYEKRSGDLIGRTETIQGPVPWAGPKSLLQLPEHVSGEYWMGEYIPDGRGGPATSRLGEGEYTFAVVLQKPVALGDAAEAHAHAAEYVERIQVLGSLEVDRNARENWDGWEFFGPDSGRDRRGRG